MANFQFKKPPAIIFEAKHRPTDAPGEITEANNSINSQHSLQNVQHNVAIGWLTNEDINDFCCCGINVDDDNEPVPENIWAPLQQSKTVGEFITPTIYPQYATGPVTDKQGKWQSFSWDEIGRMLEFHLFVWSSLNHTWLM